MKFGPFMNFVVGQNGSGKSAVLTALTLCLGAKAAVTNRGGNMKSFIKEGEHMAAVEVHLRNRGDGFRKDVYGHTVVVQRTFNRDGVNSYKTKSKSGKTISTSKKELSDIIDYMSLQVDNPMTVLSQDTARQFLSNSSDEEKYKFFMKGVQLDDLYALYQNLKGQQTVIEGVLETKAEDIRELKEDKEAAEGRFKLLRQTEDLRKNVSTLLLQLAWAQVSESEAVLENTKRELLGARNARQRSEEDIEKMEVSIASWGTKVAQAQDAVKSSSDSNSPLIEQKKELEDKIVSGANRLARAQKSERDLDQQMRSAKSQIDKAKRDAEVEKQRLSEADDGKNTLWLKEKEELIEKKALLKAQQNSHESLYQSEKAAIIDTRKTLARAEAVKSRKESDLRDAEGTLAELTSGRSNGLTVYGQNTDALLAAIDRASWKTRKPIGPCGLFIKLKHKTWSSILEKQLSKVLSGFIAFSLEDKDQLLALVRECACNHTVFYSNPNSFRLKEPSDEYLTILRALEIENEDVQRTLVTMNNIEQTILVEDHVEARKVMERCPENVKYCYSVNRQRRGNGFSIKMGYIGSHRNITCRTFSNPSQPRFWRNTYRAAQETIHALKGEISAEQEKCNDLKQAIASSEMSMGEYNAKKQTRSTNLHRTEERIDELTSLLQQDNTGMELMRLESIIKVNEERYDQYASQQGDNTNEKQRLVGIVDDLRSLVEQLNLQISESEDQTKRLQAAHNSAIQQEQQAMVQNSGLLEKLNQQDAQVSQLESSIERMENGLVSMKYAAGRIGNRIQLKANEKAKDIEGRLEKLNFELERSDARIGSSAEQIAKDFADKTEKYNEANKEVADLQSLHKALDRSFQERMERWHYFRKYISVNSRLQFHLLMSEREFDGKLVFDHNNGILQLKVQPSQQATDTKRNAKTLSGGEKSFSQICLLLALWEAMGSPFRCLDEFDVFMDAVNRGVSMGLIIKAARNSIGRQFILITPQDVSTKGIDETADVRIVRMPDPERNQTALQVRPP
ncbi:hypothetical protein DRE_06327 [Drechslerella stenobrocha 248]|uniref:RecF/RecN/SMC N-terminal domain-containing protein n=1 Tax=Drechslerella stenobrocha 248 TaxID=1043628 RepID=W7HY44_9PEZI|nr:hypothetical protein DRE_06327 [Drechslerella stenobrocha 248]